MTTRIAKKDDPPGWLAWTRVSPTALRKIEKEEDPFDGGWGPVK